MANTYFWYGKRDYQQCMGVAMGAKYAPSVANLVIANRRFIINGHKWHYIITI